MFEGNTNKFSQIFRLSVIRLFVIVATFTPLASAQAPPGPGAAWVEVSGSARVERGGRFTVRARARNLEASAWESAGGRRTVVEALVVDSTGNPWVPQPAPGRWTYAVPPGGAGTAGILIVAPDRPGRYTVLLGIAHFDAEGRRLNTVSPARWDFEVTAPARNS